ncbi:universal stress protein [Massilia sp. ST3]|uniref:universal stress protein n=1 Tax=Massilia sp. ST3 TaxID=2824903 RepID=UPI001B83F52F|nr:universal stress protein [Massilia sp. ST3]MBQ5948481.1 universal stress protein [Massilia sp. ST3]
MFIEKICVATDGSDLAVRAAQMAATLARAGGGRMVAVSVAQPQFSVRDCAAALPDAQAELARARQAALAHVDTVARIAHAGGVSCDTLTCLASAPGPEIIRLAEEQACDLIVMGTHGPNDANRLFAGSVAQYVLANSAIPVLLLRLPREASKPDFSDGPAA